MFCLAKMKKFNIRICPLCQKTLIVKYENCYPSYRCPTPWKLAGFAESHYSIICDEHDTLQKVFLSQYLLKTIIGSGRTKIYSLPTEEKCEEPKFIMEVPTIMPDDPEKLVKKIKLLIPFS